MSRIFIFALALPLLSMQCKKNNQNDCSNAICTEIFASVNVAVQDKDGNHINLQDYYTINVATGDTLRHNANGWPEGSYTVVDDSYVNKMYNRKLQFRFLGVQGNTIVVDEIYTISADCCHINKESGKDTIIIE